MGIQLDNALKAIDTQYQEQRIKTEIDSQRQGIKESKQRVVYSNRQMKQLDAESERIKAEVMKLNNDIKTGTLTQKEIEARTKAILDKLPEEIKEISRRGYGILSPVEGMSQKLKAYDKPRIDSGGYYDKNGFHRTR
jgi:bifunctional ADP-heptose synthase (sugar kinase/adenylyltransferase)